MKRASLIMIFALCLCILLCSCGGSDKPAPETTVLPAVESTVPAEPTPTQDVAVQTAEPSPDTPVSNVPEPVPTDVPVPNTVPNTDEISSPPSEGSAAPEPTPAETESIPYDPTPSAPPAHYSSSSNLISLS